MDIFNISPDPFEFIESEGLFLSSENHFDEELNDLFLNQQSTDTNRLCHSSVLRPMDLPSHRKHYGLLTFYHYRIPILFRLANNHYVPYIRFSYALNVLDRHQSNRLSPILEMVKNLPILEMSPIEIVYYDRLMHSLSSTIDLLPENHPQWSNRLLSVALLDCLIGILDCSTSFFQNNELNTEKWEQILETMREEVKSRWTIEEKLVLNQVEKQTRQANHDLDSLCISSTNIAQRRLFFEKRLDLSIVDESGGFVQIDAFIFPYVKYASENRIFLNVNDLQRHYHEYLLLSSSCIRQFSSDSSLAHAYNIISEQARENFFWNSIHGSISMSKYLPNPKNADFQLKFLSLDLFLQSKGHCFVQLFEQSSLEYLITNYKNQLARKFVVDDRTRLGGLINFEVPFLQLNHSRTYIPTETKSSRLMTNDERLFLNCLLLYQNFWHMTLIKNQKWYLEEIDMDIQSSMIEFFDQDYYERKQRKLFVHC